MVERLNRCDECASRAYCEFFKPGTNCFLHEKNSQELFGFGQSYLQKIELNSSLQQRTDWGAQKNKRCKKLAKETAELFREVQDIKEEEE